MFESLAKFIVALFDLIGAELSRLRQKLDTRGQRATEFLHAEADAVRQGVRGEVAALRDGVNKEAELVRQKVRQEGLALRKGVWDFVFAVAFLLVGAALSLVGIIVMVVGCYLLILALVDHHWIASMLSGAIVLLAAGGLLWVSRKLAD
ncbi:MAG: phage holin family protein [Phycisphaeraceae bacterium]